MILRRLTKHVKDQNWFAVTLDFIIVVTGVFLGIQIGNWNTDAALSRKAAVLERQMAFELANSAISYRLNLTYFKDVLANGEQVLADAEGTMTLSDEDYVIKAFRATQFNTISKRRYAYDEIVALGIGRRLENTTLMLAAANYYNEAWVEAAAQETRGSAYRRIFRETVPLDVQRDAREQCGDANIPTTNSLGEALMAFETDFTSLEYPCQLSLPATRIAMAARALREADGLEPALRFRITELDNSIGLMGAVDEHLQPWRMTEAELEKGVKDMENP